MFSTDGSKIRDAVVVLKTAKLEGDRLTFDVDVLEGDLSGGDGPAALFIDRFGGGFGGFHAGGFHAGGMGGFHASGFRAAGFRGGLSCGRCRRQPGRRCRRRYHPYVARGAFYRGGYGAAAVGAAAVGGAALGAAAANAAYPYLRLLSLSALLLREGASFDAGKNLGRPRFGARRPRGPIDQRLCRRSMINWRRLIWFGMMASLATMMVAPGFSTTTKAQHSLYSR